MENKSVFSNIIWSFAEKWGAQIVSFVVGIVIARMLAPEAYGTLALVSVFTSFFAVFIDFGLGNSLVQKKDADDLDFSSVFLVNMGLCTVLYLIVFLLAPFVADYYKNPEITLMVRVMGISILISGVKNIQQAYVSRALIFKKFFFATSIGTLISAAVGIFLAFKGFGTWALIVQILTNQSIDTIVLWFTVKWRPKRMFSWKRLKGLISYGWKLLVSELISQAYASARELIIGKKYTEENLAYYDKGQHFAGLVVTNINSAIDSVLLPSMSKEQDDIDKLKSMTRRAITCSVFVLAPCLIGLAAVAEPFVSVLLTDKWLPVVPYIRIFCFAYALRPIYTVNLNVIKALGRSDIYLVLEIIKKVLGLGLLLASVSFGPLAIACSLIVEAFLSHIINCFPNRKLISYGYLKQLRDVFPTILLTAVMGIAVYSIQFLPLPSILILLLQIVVGLTVYVGGAAIFKFEAFGYLIGIIKARKK